METAYRQKHQSSDKDLGPPGGVGHADVDNPERDHGDQGHQTVRHLLKRSVRPCADDLTGSTNITGLLRLAKGTLVACLIQNRSVPSLARSNLFVGSDS